MNRSKLEDRAQIEAEREGESSHAEEAKDHLSGGLDPPLPARTRFVPLLANFTCNTEPPPHILSIIPCPALRYFIQHKWRTLLFFTQYMTLPPPRYLIRINANVNTVYP